ncbi:MAG: LysE family transporter [Syntrophomonadaceae bacterium]|jgi:threonine/homoserine/homoserine lactone efflux protein
MVGAAIWTTSFFIGLSGAMMPGPLLTATIAESARRGFRAGPLIVLGHGILELALVVALVLGFSAVLTSPGTMLFISLLGGGFLIFLGATMVRDSLAGKLSIDYSLGDHQPRLHPIVTGVTISLANPYWSLWWATVGLNYLNICLQQGFGGIALFFSGHIVADLFWYSLVAAAVASGRSIMKPQIYKIIIMLCGIFLVVLGGYFMIGASGMGYPTSS